MLQGSQEPEPLLRLGLSCGSLSCGSLSCSSSLWSRHPLGQWQTQCRLVASSALLQSLAPLKRPAAVSRTCFCPLGHRHDAGHRPPALYSTCCGCPCISSLLHQRPVEAMLQQP